MTTAWSHLPNARHIDRILASVKLHPDNWYATRPEARRVVSDATWDAVSDAAWRAAWDEARDSAWRAAWDATRHAARAAALGAAWDASRDAVKDAARYAARDASSYAIMALIAWDEAGDYLNLPGEQVQILAALGDHKAVLMWPAVMAVERSKELV